MKLSFSVGNEMLLQRNRNPMSAPPVGENAQPTLKARNAKFPR
jgi:hypothetical protein